MPKEYALFDIRIRELSPNSYTVDVRSALGGDASGLFAPPIGNARYQQLAERLQRLDTDEDMLVELGQILFDSLFQGKIKDVYTRSQGGLKEGQGLRLRFDIDPSLGAIAALPWEFLYDPDQGPLAMLDMAVVRYLSQQAAPSVLAALLPLKVLVTGAVTPPEPDVQRELAEVRAALGELERSRQVKIVVEEHLTRAILQRRLREGFQIWHFIGHGSQSRDGTTGTLLFEDSTGEAEAVSARELGIFLNRSGVRLIVLDACNSAKLTTDPYRTVAPALIRAQVPAVIAMQFSVPQEATRAFAGEFYRALAEGFPIDACVTEGRKAVVGASGLRNPDWGIPVVYTRAADGKLFELPEARPATTPAQKTGGGDINITIGDKQTLSNGSGINVSEVGYVIKGVSGINTGKQDHDDPRKKEIEALSTRLKEMKLRLNALQQTAAEYGIDTPAYVKTQIEKLEGRRDLKGKLVPGTGEMAELERQLLALGGELPYVERR